MSITAAWHTGVASDPGLQRSNNEDRVFVDETAGVFLVVDGVGGQAAGEKAAEVAVEVISRELAREEGPAEHRVRAAIASANNEIFRLAQSNPEWRGMACVLTLAFANEDRITVGHVGDSRMYLVWDGKLRKLTSDHSPVGEQEDRGELTEAEAMRHPRRNEVFRDVGSRVREAYEDDFIEARSFPFHSDAAFLICSDGLSDVVPSADISAIIESYDGDPGAVTRQLVDAANHGGGKDNISVVFVAGPEFTGTGAHALQEARSRHAITRPRGARIDWRKVAGRLLWLVAGILLGIGFWTVLPRVLPTLTQQAGKETPRPTITVNPADPRGIERALIGAKAGDTVDVPPGDYAGPIQLREGVNVVSEQPRAAVIHADLNGIAVVARGVKSGRVSGFRIEGTPANPLKTGLLLADSSLDADDLEIIGALDCGIRIQGLSKGVLRANYIHDNPGCGISIAGQNTTRLAGNRIAANGGLAGKLRRGLEIFSPARPLLDNNVISGNGIRDLGALTPDYDQEIRERNIVDAPGARP